MTPGTIFVSHRAEYGSLVKELKKAIETTSRGKIRVFISEELRGAENWREAIKSQLTDAQSLFLVYGAPYEDWTWCFYEAGFFAGIDAGQKKLTANLLYFASQCSGPWSLERIANGDRH